MGRQENRRDNGKWMTRIITLDLDVKCKRCGKCGATPGGYCLECVLKNMKEGKYDHVLNKPRPLRNGSK